MSCCFEGCFGGGGSAHTPPVSSAIQRGDVVHMTSLTKKLPPGLRLALIEAAGAGDPDILTAAKTRPLFEAIKYEKLDIVMALLDASATLDIKDIEGLSVLDYTRKCGNIEIMEVIQKVSSKQKTSAFVEGLELLPTVPLFSSLHPADYPRLAEAFTSKTFKPGAYIIKQGESGNDMFVIQTGIVQVFVKPPGGDKSEKLATLSAGDYFGETALLTDAPRNATIQAFNVVEAKVLTRANFKALDLIRKLHFAKRKAVQQVEGTSQQAKGDTTKNEAEHELIKKAVLANTKFGPLLKHLSAKELNMIIDCAFKVEVQKNTKVIEEGQLQADLFYVVESGSLEALRNKTKVADYGPGTSFGELALLFRAPRAATVQATTQAKLWALHRQDLKDVMQAPLRKKLEGFAKLIGRVQLLQDLSPQVIKDTAAALVESAYFENEYIIKQGEEGTTFFILYQGEVVVENNGKEVSRLSGDPARGTASYFGERALFEDKPRAASVRCVSKKVVALALDRETFLHLKGEHRETVSQNANLIDYRKDTLETLGLLGCGGFGKVTLVKCHLTGNTFALKALSKGHVLMKNQEKSVMNEKAILQMTHSPFLVRSAATFNGPEHIFFLLEPAMGGELFTVYKRNSLHGSEKHACFYVACVLRAFEHLHARNIIYRDLKPENLLLDGKGYCKVTDFGLSKFVIGYTYTTCGTPDYFAPEMVLGSGHSLAVDWWTLGVLAYELMMSEPPFAADDTIHIFHNVQRGIECATFPSTKSSWPNLVKCLCKQEPIERLPMRKGGAKNVEEHAWFLEGKFDWQGLDKRTMPAPFTPKVKSNQDLDNFQCDEEEAPPEIPYKDPGTGWDKAFESTRGPATFD